jgi:hypothetical protein
VNYVNNSDFDIYYYVLDNHGAYSESQTYPDTTISFDKKSMGSPLKANMYHVVNIGTLPIENFFKKLPGDTLSVFYFHTDTVSRYSWEEIQHDYKILRRYDLSLEDIILLKNEYDVPEIPYPPNELMKDMKMYPPYEE